MLHFTPQEKRLAAALLLFLALGATVQHYRRHPAGAPGGPQGTARNAGQ
ncbi:MAG: hypothetical protein PHQ12_06500 [Chthoniobacteraceae bacterium]|nr:hypothetical protein [Chthoniobacteraceae bacterium]